MAFSGSTAASLLAQFDIEENLVAHKYAEIIVVRHGETEWNVDGRFQGQTDVELNDVGRQQAVAVADRISRWPKISAVYSSDLKRAFYTAEMIAKRCGGHKVTRDSALRERHVGELQGVLFRDAARVNPTAHEAFLSDREDMEIPGGGESLRQVYERCAEALGRIAKKHVGERVVVVSHGVAIGELYKRARGRAAASGMVPNTSVSVLNVSGDGEEWIIKTWGDVSHLSYSGFLVAGQAA